MFTMGSAATALLVTRKVPQRPCSCYQFTRMFARSLSQLSAFVKIEWPSARVSQAFGVADFKNDVHDFFRINDLPLQSVCEAFRQ